VEAALPFAALLELCRPILTRLDELGPAQAHALRGTFGVSDDQGVTTSAIGPA
jgi:hypothetical protein